MNAVVNCTVVSNFAAVGRLDLLRDTAGPLFLPLEVYDEILVGQMAGYAFYDGIEQCIVPPASDGWLHLVTMTDEELRFAASLPAGLHQGERACLAIARQRGRRSRYAAAGRDLGHRDLRHARHSAAGGARRPPDHR